MEVLVVISILSLIVLVLMSVFNSTQAAFRAGVTQTDVLEGSRSAMELMTADLKTMTASGGYSNSFLNTYYVQNWSAANFYASSFFTTKTLLQNLPASNEPRSNVLQGFFILSRGNVGGHNLWIGTGYAVDVNSSSPLYPLYRFSTNVPASFDPAVLINTYLSYVSSNNRNFFTNSGWSHLIDGVVDLRVHAYAPNGYQMTNTYQFISDQWITNKNVWFSQPINGEVGFYFFSNALPAAVELQVGVLEDRALQRAESLNDPAIIGLSLSQSNYLANQVGRVHIFRQRVTIPNLDRTSYQ
ncbi:MAG TPA: hypothetical protein VGO57_01100 [Verrucomicrobiae bacterium]